MASKSCRTWSPKKIRWRNWKSGRNLSAWFKLERGEHLAIFSRNFDRGGLSYQKGLIGFDELTIDTVMLNYGVSLEKYLENHQWNSSDSSMKKWTENCDSLMHRCVSLYMQFSAIKKSLMKRSLLISCPEWKASERACSWWFSRNEKRSQSSWKLSISFFRFGKILGTTKTCGNGNFRWRFTNRKLYRLPGAIHLFYSWLQKVQTILERNSGFGNRSLKMNAEEQESLRISNSSLSLTLESLKTGLRKAYQFQETTFLHWKWKGCSSTSSLFCQNSSRIVRRSLQIGKLLWRSSELWRAI